MTICNGDCKQKGDVVKIEREGEIEKKEKLRVGGLDEEGIAMIWYLGT